MSSLMEMFIVILFYVLVPRINLHGCSKVYESGFLLDDECWRTYEKKVHYVLEKGLLDRAKLIRVIWKCAPSNWNIESVRRCFFF